MKYFDLDSYIMGFFCGFALSLLIFWMIRNESEQDMIKMGLKEYNKTTEKIQWVKPEYQNGITK